MRMQDKTKSQTELANTIYSRRLDESQAQAPHRTPIEMTHAASLFAYSHHSPSNGPIVLCAQWCENVHVGGLEFLCAASLIHLFTKETLN
jgi:hypothetical protein